MTDVASRELRNNTRAVLARVEAGEVVTITIDGRVVAELRTPSPRRQFVSKERFLTTVLRQADPGLAAELRELAPDTTDDLSW